MKGHDGRSHLYLLHHHHQQQHGASTQAAASTPAAVATAHLRTLRRASRAPLQYPSSGAAGGRFTISSCLSAEAARDAAGVVLVTLALLVYGVLQVRQQLAVAGDCSRHEAALAGLTGADTTGGRRMRAAPQLCACVSRQDRAPQAGFWGLRRRSHPDGAGPRVAGTRTTHRTTHLVFALPRCR